MRKVICMLIAVVSLALFSGQAYAQRCLPGMKGVELRGGFAEGSKYPLNHYAGFAVSGYTKKANRWVVGAEYLLKNYEYRNVSVPRAQFTAEGGGLTGYSDPLYTERLAESAQQTGRARCALLTECERQLLEGCTVVPLLGQQKRLLVADGIKGLVFDPFTPVLDLTYTTKN